MINQDQLLSTLRSILAIVGGWAVGRGYITNDQLVLIGGALTALVPVVWGIAVHTTSATIKAGAAADGVEKIVLKTQTQADAVAPKDASGVPQPDNILSPSEDIAHVAASPEVKAVVMATKAAADANPATNVIGPASLAPSAPKKP